MWRPIQENWPLNNLEIHCKDPIQGYRSRLGENPKNGLRQGGLGSVLNQCWFLLGTVCTEGENVSQTEFYGRELYMSCVDLVPITVPHTLSTFQQNIYTFLPSALYWALSQWQMGFPVLYSNKAYYQQSSPVLFKEK